MNKPSRRGILQGLAIGTAAAATGVATTAHAAPVQAFALAHGTEPWWLLAPLGVGSRVANGWVIRSLSQVRKGASVLTLEHAELGPMEVHLCAHDGKPRGVAHSALIDLIAMDGGRGDRATEESLGRALLDISKRIRRNEVSEDGDLGPLSRMLPHNERVDAYGPENL